ncbi:MAG TPA: hypothetical protein VMI56_02030 [Reyranella sp.]|nr:hypothetical protein [Reyranella sp.]
MKSIGICLITGLALASAAPAFAQGNDLAYCQALIAKYQTYVGHNSGGRHEDVDQNANARMAIDQCNAGDASGIKVLERELTNARVDLPARG